MKENPVIELQGVLTRDFVEVGGLPSRLAGPLAEFAAISVGLFMAGRQQYYPDAAVKEYRNQAMRQAHRRALANVQELTDLTGLSQRQVYRILSWRERAR